MATDDEVVLTVKVEIARNSWPVRGHVTLADGVRQAFWGWEQLRLMVDPLLQRSVGSGAALTSTEARVVSLVCEGLTTPDIARLLVASPRTIQGHLYRVFKKLGVRSRTELVREWIHRTYLGRSDEISVSLAKANLLEPSDSRDQEGT